MMKKYDGIKIINNGTLLANEMLKNKLKDKPWPIDLIKTIQSPEILGSEFGLDIVRNMILGALMEYHAQLRANLLEKGIDIGEFEEDTD